MTDLPATLSAAQREIIALRARVAELEASLENAVKGMDMLTELYETLVMEMGE